MIRNKSLLLLFSLVWFQHVNNGVAFTAAGKYIYQRTMADGISFASWRNIDGAFQFYKDGVLHLHSTGFKKGYTIRGGNQGSLVLGQDQDTIGGRYESHQSFQGFLSNVNVWSYVLSASTIRGLSKSCLSGSGDVYKWSDFIHGIKGKTAVVIPSPCYQLSSQG